MNRHLAWLIASILVGTSGCALETAPSTRPTPPIASTAPSSAPTAPSSAPTAPSSAPTADNPSRSPVTPAQQSELSERITRLTAEVGDLQNALARLIATSRQQDDEMRAMERRLAELSEPKAGSIPKGFAPSQVSPAPPPGPTPKIDRAEDLYDAGLDRVRAGDLDSAVLIFYTLIANHPAHRLRENAQFMVADIFYGQRDVKGALAEFESLLAARSKGQRAPETLVKIGLCHRALGSEADARRAWERVTREFPDSASARDARLLLRGRSGG